MTPLIRLVEVLIPEEERVVRHWVPAGNYDEDTGHFRTACNEQFFGFGGDHVYDLPYNHGSMKITCSECQVANATVRLRLSRG